MDGRLITVDQTKRLVKSALSKTTLPLSGRRSSNVNLFPNWYFLDPINQRGKDSYRGNGFGLDTIKPFDTTATITVGKDGLSVSDTMSHHQLIILVPLHFIIDKITPGTYTISALATGNITNVRFRKVKSIDDVQVVDYNVSGKFVSFSLEIDDEFYAKSTTTQSFVGFYLESSDVKLQAIKFEKSDVQTLAYEDEKNPGNYILFDAYDKKAALDECKQWLVKIDPFFYKVGWVNESRTLLHIPCYEIATLVADKSWKLINDDVSSVLKNLYIDVNGSRLALTSKDIASVALAFNHLVFGLKADSDTIISISKHVGAVWLSVAVDPPLFISAEPT